MKNKNLPLLLCLLIALISGQGYAQCTGASCNFTINTNTSYTIPAGQTYCLQKNNYTGTITFGNGSTLCIGSGLTFNSGTLVFTGTTGTINNYGSSNESFTIPNGYTVNNYGTYSGTLTQSTGSTINNAGTISGSIVQNGGTLTNNAAGTISATSSISGTFTNNGSITGTTTINNGGTLTNNNPMSGNITMNTGSTFDNNSTYSGTMTNNGGTINNNGTLSNAFTLNGSLANAGTVSNGITLNTGSVMTNSGTVNGTITISGGTFLNASSTNLNATISMSSGSFLNLSPSNYTGNLSESGGTVTNASGATISGTANVTGGTLTNNGTETGNLSSSSGTTVTNNGTMTISGGGPVAGNFTSTTGSTTTNNITMNGAVNIGGTFTNNTNGNLSGTTTITGSLNNGGNMSGTVVISTGGTMTNNSNNVSGGTNITVNGTLANNAYNLQGNITVNSGGAVTNASGGLIQGGTLTGNAGSTITNNGTIADNISESGTLNNNSGGRISGTLAGLTGSTITNSGTIVNTVTISGGTFTNTSTGNINGGSNLFVTGGTVTNSGSVTAVNISGGNVTNTTTINNLTISGGTLTNTGTLNGSMIISGGAITNASGATIDPSNFNTSAGSGSLTNNGTMILPSGTTNIYSGYTITNNGTMSSGPITVNSGGTLTLDGTQTINGSILNNGTINLAGSLSLGSNTYSGSGAMNETSSGCNTFTVSSNNSNGTFNGGQAPYGGGLIVNSTSGSATLTNGASAVISAPVLQPTGFSGSLSGLTVTGSFTSPSAAITGYIVLRYIGSSVPGCSPSNNVEYTVGNTIGTCTVAAIVASSSTGTKTFTDVIPAGDCGQTVYYRIFSYNGAGECVTYDLLSSPGPLTGSVAIPAFSATITPSGATTFCAPATVTLTATAGTTYAWNTLVNTQAITVTVTGNYQVTVTNSSGCTASATQSVTVNQAPAPVTVSGGGTQCGGTETLTATGGAGGTIYWENTTSGGTSTATPSTSQTLSVSGTYYFNAQNACGWGAQGSATVVINAVPAAPTAVTATASTICAGQTSQLNATSAGNHINWWTAATGGTLVGNSVSGANFAVSPVATTTYYAESYTAAGCASASRVPVTVTVNTVPAAVTVSGGTTQCGGTETLTATGGTGGTIYWQNTTSGGTSVASPSSSQVVSATGTYYFNAENSCGWGTQGSATVTINNPGTITPYLNTSAGGGWLSVTSSTICSGGWVEFGSQSSAQGTAGTWTISGPNGFFSYSRDTVISNLLPINAGTYTQTYYNPNGCTVSQDFTIVINPAPAAAISGNTCIASMDTLTASGGGTYLWSTTATSAAINPLAAGTYKVTVTSAAGCTASASITINSYPVVGPITGTTTVCAGSTTALADATGGGVWTSSNTAVATMAGNVVTGVSAGTATISYTVTNASGCTAFSTTTVTVHAAPVVAPLAGTDHECIGSTTTLTDATPGGTWTSSAPGTASIAAGVVTGVAAGNATISYAVTSAGCTTTVTAIDTVVALPAVNAITGTTTVCSGSTTTLADATAGGVWSSSNTAVATVAAGVVTGVAGGTATISYTVTNASGCTKTATATVTVNQSPTLAATSNTPVCVGSTIDLTATAAGSTSYTYSWSGPAGFTSSSSAPTVANAVSADSGSYSITVTDNHSCTVSATTSVNVKSNCADSTTVGINGGGSSYAPCTQILRFDHYNDVVASSAAGQNHTWVLQNGDILTMNVKRLSTAGAFTSVVAPTWSGAAFGSTGYTGLSGRTVLYTNSSGYSKLTFSNIVLKDSLGNVIPNFTLLGIDGESTDGAERDTILSNGTSWFDYDTINPPPTVGSIPSETGIGTNQLVWTGSGPSNARARAVSTNNPTTFTFSTVAGGLQGFAMGISNPILARTSITVCSGVAFNNTPTNLPHGTTYTWAVPTVSPPGSVTGATAQTTSAATVSQTLVNTTNSDATVTYTVLPSNTCSNQTFTFTVIVHGGFSATVSPGTPQCAGSSIQVYATPSPAGTYTYSWSGPSSFTATGDTFTIASSTLSSAGRYELTMTNTANGCIDTASGVLQVVNCLSVSGSVFDDANGDGLLNGAEVATDRSQTLYSVLSDTTGKVVAYSTVAANGAFTMGQMLPNTSGFRVYVSTTQPAIGSAAGTYSWPSNWVSTRGQYGTNNRFGTGLAPAGLIPVATGTSNVTNMMIGFDQLPTTTSETYLIPYPGINSIKRLTSTTGLGVLSGSDPEDGTYGTGNTFIINSLAGMNGNKLYYDANNNGILESWEQITGYTVISNYNPGLLYAKFTGAGSLSAKFTYSAQDAAGNANASPLNYIITWVGTLPVQMEYFTAAQNNDHSSILQWATATEIDNSYFEVQRSPDAVQWQSLGQVAGAGTSDQEHYYSFIDGSPLSGVNYYRLKQVDVDGNFVYSEIAEVSFDGQGTVASSMKVYPNPVSASSPLTIELSDAGSVISQVTITNSLGQVVYTDASIQSNTAYIGSLGLPAGIYVVSVFTDGSKPMSSKLVIR